MFGLRRNRSTINWVLIVVVLLVVSNGLNFWSTDKKYQQTLAQNEEAMRGLQHLSDSVTTRYDLITTDLEEALRDRGRLREHVDYIESNYKINVTEVSELVANRDTVYVERPGLVIPTDKNSGIVFMQVDTLGMDLNAEIRYPDGRYKLDVDFKPLDLVVTVERTEEGLKRHTAYFPNQPWYTVNSWEVIVEEGEGGPPSLIQRLFGDLSDIGFTVGGGIGVEPTGMALLTAGDIHLGMDSDQRVILLKTIPIFE